MRWSLGRWLGAVGLIFSLVVVVGCAEEETQIDLIELGRSPGGEVAALEVVERAGSAMLVAPAGDRLYTREIDGGPWQSRVAAWPPRVVEGQDIFSVVGRAARGGDFSTESYFTYYEGRLWVVALPAVGQRPVLLWSEDLGLVWREVPPPQEVLEYRPAQQGASSLIPSVRLLKTPQGLYLVDGRRVWRWEWSEGDEVDGSMWKAVDLKGVKFGDEVGDEEQAEELPRGPGGRPERSLPRRIRHYLPAVGEDGVELVTVYGVDLRIYRRPAGAERFEEVGRLDDMDRALLRAPFGQGLYLMGRGSLYRSDDQGESWVELSLDAENRDRERLGQMRFFPDPKVGKGFSLWVAGASGSLWRSGDGGRSFERMRERDPDGRGISGLVRVEMGGSMWISTAGQGVWRFSEAEQAWVDGNQGLYAGRSFDAAVTDEGEILVGSDAGLFRVINEGGRMVWDALQARATSAIFIHPESGQIISGTLGGSVVVRSAEGEEHVAEAAPVGDGEGLFFRPLHYDSQGLPGTAIIKLTQRRGAQDIFAWSHQQGPLTSNDGGASWRRMQLGGAFRNALAGSVITHFLAGRDQYYFAVTRSLSPQQPAQLWRSADGGQTWAATYSFMEEEEGTPMQLVRLPDGGPMVMAHGSRVAMSRDLGETWTILSGSWEQGLVRGMELDGDQVVLAVELPHRSELLWLEDPTVGVAISARQRLEWPTSGRLRGERPLGFSVAGERIVIEDGATIYTGLIPRRKIRLPGSITVLIVLGAIILLSAIAFGYLRTWGQR